MSPTRRWRILLILALALTVGGLALAGRGGRPIFRPQPKPVVKQGIHQTLVPRAVKPGRSATFVVLHQQIHSNPARVIRHLWVHRHDPQVTELKRQEPRLLLRRSVDRLAALGQHGQDPWTSLHTANRVRGLLWDMSLDRPRDSEELTALVSHGLRTTLREGVKDTLDLGGKKQWLETAAHARQWVQQDSAFYQGTSRTRLQDRLEVGRVLESIGNLHAHIVTLDQLDKLTVPGKGPGILVKKLNDQTLPAELRPVVGGLRALGELEATVASWKQKPAVDQLLQGIQELDQALQQLPEAERPRALGTRLRQQLAVRAFLEGDAASAEQLWAGTAQADAATILRDMKVLLTGQGKVATPATQAGLTGEGLPPGLRPLLPEASAAGWRPPPREKGTAGLPALEEAARQAEPLRQVVQRYVTKEREQLGARFQPHVQQLQTFQQRHQAEADKQALIRQQLLAALKSPPRPMEWLWALDQFHQQRALKDIVDTLNQGRAEEEQDERVERALSYLTPRLVTGEVRQEIVWEVKQGNEVAEIVADLEHLLAPAHRTPGSDIRHLVRLDEILSQLDPAPDAFEYARAEQGLTAGQTPAQILTAIREQRRQQQLRSDLERALAYFEQPLTEEELKTARSLLEKGKHVADVVAAFPDALSPERRGVPGGIREAILLDEVNQHLAAPLNAGEFLRARHLLRRGSPPIDVATLITLQRPEETQASQ